MQLHRVGIRILFTVQIESAKLQITIKTEIKLRYPSFLIITNPDNYYMGLLGY